MKLIKRIALIALMAAGISSAIIYTSCTKNACKAVNCLNGGMCSGGTCTCDTGIGGSNCQTVYRELYGGQGGGGQIYMGNASISYSSLDSAQIDSGYANKTVDSNTLVFSYGSDSTYSMMHLVWNDGSNVELSTTIMLTNNTSAGSIFSVTSTVGGPNGAYTFSGSGTVSATSASINLVGVPTNTATPTVYVTLSNCTVQ